MLEGCTTRDVDGEGVACGLLGSERDNAGAFMACLGTTACCGVAATTEREDCSCTGCACAPNDPSVKGENPSPVPTTMVSVVRLFGCGLSSRQVRKFQAIAWPSSR